MRRVPIVLGCSVASGHQASSGRRSDQQGASYALTEGHVSIPRLHRSGWSYGRHAVERRLSTRMQTFPRSGDQVSRRQFLRSVAGLGLSTAGLALLEACASPFVTPPASADKLETTTIKIPLT